MIHLSYLKIDHRFSDPNQISLPILQRLVRMFQTDELHIATQCWLIGPPRCRDRIAGEVIKGLEQTVCHFDPKVLSLWGLLNQEMAQVLTGMNCSRLHTLTVRPNFLGASGTDYNRGDIAK